MIIPYITEREKEIPKLIYKFRFLSSTQIQKLLDHRDKRRINGWLRDLNKKEFIKRIDEDTDFERIRFRTKPIIYRLGINGIRFLKTQNEGDPTFRKLFHKFYRENDRSDEFITQNAFLADIYFDLKNSINTSDKLIFYTKSDYQNPQNPYSFLTEMNPNAYVAKKVGKGRTRQFLLHIIPESMLRYRSLSLNKKIRDYLAYYFGGEWENHTRTAFPTLLFILPDMKALITFQRYAQNIFNDNDNPNVTVWLTTKGLIQKQGFTNVVWEDVK
jgi:hypothetical protein